MERNKDRQLRREYSLASPLIRKQSSARRNPLQDTPRTREDEHSLLWKRQDKEETRTPSDTDAEWRQWWSEPHSSSQCSSSWAGSIWLARLTQPCLNLCHGAGQGSREASNVSSLDAVFLIPTWTQDIGSRFSCDTRWLKSLVLGS